MASDQEFNLMLIFQHKDTLTLTSNQFRRSIKMIKWSKYSDCLPEKTINICITFKVILWPYAYMWYRRLLNVWLYLFGLVIIFWGMWLNVYCDPITGGVHPYTKKAYRLVLPLFRLKCWQEKRTVSQWTNSTTTRNRVQERSRYYALRHHSKTIF